MPQLQLGHGGRDAVGFVGVVFGRTAVGDRAVWTVPRTDVAQDHERRGAVLPALAAVGAVGLLTNSVEVQVPHEALEPGIVGPAWRSNLQPARLSDLIERFNHCLEFNPLIWTVG